MDCRSSRSVGAEHRSHLAGGQGVAMKRTRAALAVAGLAAVALTACDQLTDPPSRGTVRLVASETVTGAEIAAATNRPLPYTVEPGDELSFEGAFDDPPEVDEYPIDRLQSASAQFRFATNLDLGAVVDVTMRSGNRQCVLASNMHAGEEGAAPVHWSKPCTDIFFSPDRIVDVHVVSTNDQEVTVGAADSVTVSVHAVFNFK
jgi:hypothetical protein